MAGPQYASAIMWTLGALVLLVVVLFLIRIVRGSSGTFVAGGRNRRARLAIMDAAAIDNQRRLVLVRRDDVEHLILIGGPTDVVVEHNIVAATALPTPPVQTGSDLPNGRNERPAPRPAPPVPERPRATLQQRQEPVVAETYAARAPEPAPMKAERPEPVVLSVEREAPLPVAPTPNARIEPTPPTPSVAPLTAAASIGGTRSGTDRAPEISMPQPQAPELLRGEPDRRIEPLRAEARATDLDTALQEELKAPLVSAGARPAAEPSLEEEMKRLLGDLSIPTRG
jgi:hypothetical protein